MCGRYSFVPTARQLETQLRGVALPADVSFSYHIAPTERAWVIASDAPHALQAMYWGLVPAWAEAFRPSGRTINARAETVWEKPTFRDAARRRRCVVPADSFYEWRRQPNGQRLPYRILPADGSLLFMAGIWEEWRGPNGAYRSFAIITVPASADLTDLHDRMPALLLSEEECRAWLYTGLPLQNLQPLLKTAPTGWLTHYRVSERLNKPGDANDASLHEPAPD
ncbi:MAG: SOS response-associated peptidase [Saprospiraceae bacterium]|nr:SOS response-associated peptidase [Saprospiraceae bacterium]MDW8229518.1 SOS response-associated peptidase [Saprospiraceae bacterium]